MKITSHELRAIWSKFYEEKGHKLIAPLSLVSDGETGVLFTVAGMQAPMPYLLGAPSPLGNRVYNIQGCIRTNDIESVGDNTHCTFFEMMGNWSFGDYFKQEKTGWSLEFLTKHMGLKKDNINATVFEGDKVAPKDEETVNYLLSLGMKKENIHYLPAEDNWWGLGLDNTPCGPCQEWFYAGKDGNLVELGNDVYMSYVQKSGGKFVESTHKCVDTGFGLERNLVFLNGVESVYDTDLFIPAIKKLEELSGKKYKDYQRPFRIIADHTRTATMLLGDARHLEPSNTLAGYVLRRLIRRACLNARKLGLKAGDMALVSKEFVNLYKDISTYKELKESEEFVYAELNKEEEKFNKTLEAGLKEFNRLVEGMIRFTPENKVIAGAKVFRLFDTFGFPFEITKELAEEQGFSVDEVGFNEAFKKHREVSGNLAGGLAKGGMLEQNEISIKYHTATHLLHQALKIVTGQECRQNGSNITSERLRFDFTLDHKMTEEEIQKTEDLVNDQIKKGLSVVKKEMTIDEAKETGAIGDFSAKYGDKVFVYFIGDFSKEICGGPHVENTSTMGTFKIIKEEAVSAGTRRIKAVLK